MNKTILQRVSWTLLAFPLQLVMAEDLPKPFGFDRYQVMSDRSPFAVATAVAAPAETPNFAKDLYIANCMHSPEADLVTVASSTDRAFKKYLTTSTVVDGYGISNIEWSEKVGATKVTITKEGQSATLGFNEALLRQPTAGGQPPVPGQNPAAAQGAQPPPVKQAEGKDVKMDPTGAASQAGAVPAAASAQQVPGAAQQGVTKAMPVPGVPNQSRTRGVIPRNPSGPSMKQAQPQPQN